VPRVDTAIDCGTHINPERIQSQIEGAAIMELSLAKHGEMSFKGGRVQQKNFDDFPVGRMTRRRSSPTSIFCRRSRRDPSTLSLPPQAGACLRYRSGIN
jgi:hypothetical protein